MLECRSRIERAERITMTELPPLPEPPCTVPFCQGNNMGYTADQMRAYAEVAVKAER